MGLERIVDSCSYVLLQQRTEFSSNQPHLAVHSCLLTSAPGIHFSLLESEGTALVHKLTYAQNKK